MLVLLFVDEDEVDGSGCVSLSNEKTDVGEGLVDEPVVAVVLVSPPFLDMASAILVVVVMVAVLFMPSPDVA